LFALVHENLKGFCFLVVVIVVSLSTKPFVRWFNLLKRRNLFCVARQFRIAVA
jgi:hypothetical protein